MSPRDARSNYHMAKVALLDRVPIPSDQVLRMRGEDPPEAAADAYAVELRKALGDDGRLDLVLLGLGHDGHTASLFPGLAAASETRRTVMASYVEFVGMWRLSLTPAAINAARRAVFVVTGDDKAEILNRVLQGPREPVVLPAQAIRPSERPAIWLLDRAAAAKLKGTHGPHAFLRRRWSGPEPPVGDEDRDQDNSDQQQQQRRVLNPGDRGNRDAEKGAGDAKLPGPEVEAGDEDAEPEQRQQHQPMRIGVERALNVADGQEVHRDQHGQPIAGPA